MKNPDVLAGPDRQLGRDDRDNHHDDQWDRRKARQGPQDDHRTADNLDDADKRTHDVGKRYADAGEAPCAEDLWENKLLDALRQKDNEADQQPEEKRPARCISSQSEAPTGHATILSIPERP